MLFYTYPATTAFIDDDKDFLTAIANAANIDQNVIFTEPNHAVEALLKTDQVNRLHQAIYQPSSLKQLKYPSNGGLITFDPIRLHEEIYNHNRFKDVAVVIIDYYMNALNGIEVCQKLQDLPAKKILLTGGATKNIWQLKLLMKD